MNSAAVIGALFCNISKISKCINACKPVGMNREYEQISCTAVVGDWKWESWDGWMGLRETKFVIRQYGYTLSVNICFTL